MSYDVKYKIEAIDRITHVFRSMHAWTQKNETGVAKLNTSLSRSQRTGSRSIDRLKSKFVSLENRASKVPKNIFNGFKKLSNKLGPVGTTIAGAVSLHAVGGFVKDSLNAASDLNEAKNKAQAIFGKGYQDVAAWAKNSRDEMGMSKAMAFETSSSFAGLFKNTGASEDQAKKMAQLATKLAADLGSFHNLNTEESVQKLMSTFKGESDPAMRFNVLIDEATLKQKALEMGLISTTKGALPKAIRTQAIYAAVLEQTKDAQGDFMKTGNGFANMQKKLSEGWKDLSAGIGQVFMPYAIKLQQWGLESLDWIEANASTIKTWAKWIAYAGGTLVGLYTAAKLLLFPVKVFKMIAGPAMFLVKVLRLGKVAMFAFNVVARMSPFGWVATAIGAVVYLWNNFDWFKNWIIKAWDYFAVNPFNWMLDVIDDYIPGFSKAFDIMWTAVKNKFFDGIKWIKDMINSASKMMGFGVVFKGEIEKPKPDEDKPKPTDDKKPKPTGNGPIIDNPEGNGLLQNMGGGQALGAGAKKPGVKDRLDGMVQAGGKEIKNITINIAKLVESLNINTQTLGMSKAQIKSEMTRVLLTAVNDANYS